MTDIDIIMPAQPQSSQMPRALPLRLADIPDVLKKGFEDFWAMPTHIVYLALIYPVAGLIIGGATYDNDTIQLLYPLAAGFALLGPLAAIWTYELSRRRELGLDTSWRHAFDVFYSPSLPAILALAFGLLVLFVVWVACAQAIFYFNFGDRKIASVWELASLVANTREGMNLFIFGNLAGLLFAMVAGATTVIAFPMLLDRRVNAGVAVATSLRVVAKNPGVMAVWGLIVAAILLVASLPFLVGLALAVPILGHATWHLYRKAVEPPMGERPVHEARAKGVRYAADFPACLFSRSRES
jgi:uncharacterized membrane protein